jgi:molybdopterin-guanine dinucleotide biosynthesis protein A
MGTDKAALVFEGEPLARRVARVLVEVAETVLVASGDGSRLGWLGLEQVADAVPEAGPLSGIVAGLERAGTPLVAVVAVDMPFASAELLRFLAALWSGEDAVVPVTKRGAEPLHAVYATESAGALRESLESGDRSVSRAVAALRVRTVGPAEWSAADPSASFSRNVNRPQDLA